MPVCSECQRTVNKIRTFDGLCDMCRMREYRRNHPAKLQEPETYNAQPRFDLHTIPTRCPKCGSPCARDGYPDEVFCYNCGSTILPFVRLPHNWVEPNYVRSGWTRLTTGGYTIFTSSPATA